MTDMKKTKLLALITSALMLIPMSAGVSVSAADAEEDFTNLILDGLRRVIVTTSDSQLENSDEDVECEKLFDNRASTGCTVALEAGECGDDKTFTVYTATRAPEAVETFAMLFEGEPGTVLAVDVYATNDSLLLDWTHLTVERPVDKENGYHIVNIVEEPEKYSFYRLDITLEIGDAYTLNEILLYKDINDDAIFYWGDSTDLADGELPELIEVPRKTEDKNPETGILFSPLYKQVFGK